MKKGKISLLDALIREYPRLSRKDLTASIYCGEVYRRGERLRDPRQMISPAAELQLIREKYVGRGGYKLEAALSHWDIRVEGQVCLDAGASTGGFTDCLLSAGAALVHAVDVGYNQLAYKLRNDSRVRVWERTNVMDISALDPVPSIAAADLSFRSLRKAASRIISLTSGKQLIVLVKPQFELTKEHKGFNGVIKEEELLFEVLKNLFTDLEDEGLRLINACFSPITGRRGNREVLLELSSCDSERKPSRGREGMLASLREEYNSLVS